MNYAFLASLGHITKYPPAAGGGINIGASSKGTGGDTSGDPITTQASGSTFVVVGVNVGGTSAMSCTDSKSNVYSQAGTQVDNGVTVSMFYKENGIGGSSHTFTVTNGASVFAMEITGAATASYDSGSHAEGSDDTSPYTVTSGTLAQAASLVVLGYGHETSSNPANFAESTGFTIAESEQNGASNWSGFIAYKIVAATTALTPSVTNDGTGFAGLHIAAFKEA